MEKFKGQNTESTRTNTNEKKKKTWVGSTSSSFDREPARVADVASSSISNNNRDELSSYKSVNRTATTTPRSNNNRASKRGNTQQLEQDLVDTKRNKDTKINEGFKLYQ